jgi:hypothetical protein
MKKISVYFTDPESEMLEAMAAQAGITFAEALRRVLDEWSAYKKGKPMTTPTTGRTRSTVYVVHLDEDGERTTLTFRNADVAHDDYNHTVTVYRVKKDGSEGRTLAQFAEADVSSWYIDAAEEDEEDGA